MRSAITDSRLLLQLLRKISYLSRRSQRLLNSYGNPSLSRDCYCATSMQGVKLTYFSSSHLAPKYFKVVANSKKLVVIMTHIQCTNNFYPVTCLSYKEDTTMGHIQRERLPKSKMASGGNDRFTFEIMHVLHFTNLQQSLDLQVRCDQKFQSPIWRLIFRIWSPK